MKRALAALALLAATLGAAGPGQESRKNPFTQPHVLRFGDIVDLTSLNPMFDNELALARLSSLCMAWLVRYDRSGHPIPELVSRVPTQANGDVSGDGKTLIFHLRRGVKWSDGAPFDADDVVFTTHAMLDPRVRVVSREGWDRIVEVREPDKFTVVYRLSAPYSSFFPTFFGSAGGNPAILPKHLLAGADLNSAGYNAKPVGIGPFRYVEWRRNDRIVLEPNPFYFRGLPKLRRIEYRIVPNRNTLLTELETGELDLWPEAARAYYPRLAGLRGFVVTRQPSLAFNHLDFNLQRPPLDDVRVRRALALALDRAAAVAEIYHGIGIVQNGVFSQASPFFDPHIPTTPRDLARAKALLDEAGWRLGPDGYRTKNGRRLAIEFVSNAGSSDTDTLIELIRSWWKDAGVDLQRKTYDTSLMFALASEGGIMSGGKFDAIVTGTVLSPSGDLADGFGCRNFSPNGANVTHWCDRRAQAAMDGLERSYDLASQQRFAHIIQERMDADMPIYVLSVLENLYAANSDLKNFRPNTVTPFDDFMDVDI